MQHRILMVSDFFYPNCGGVESHIYQLSQCLINRGHKVVVYTHAYGERIGVRYITNGLKAYYSPRMAAYQSGCLPNLYGGFRLLRKILIREQISLVHCHQAYSAMGGDAMVYARTMGIKVIFTDHSLFGFADFSSIFINKYLKFFLCDIPAMICVSHTSKENLVLRACVPPSRVSVIPNDHLCVLDNNKELSLVRLVYHTHVLFAAVDATQFEPKSDVRAKDIITIVCLTRLVYRKGLDLIAAIMPEVCYRRPEVRFIICGDGPKKTLLEEVVARNGLQKQVQLLRGVPHDKARSILIQGDIFLNASLTEAFCIAIVEAASAGLKVVSTRVGGVSEVLPPHMVILSEPDPQSLLDGVEAAIDTLHMVDPWKQHREIKNMYSWQSVARRTEVIYNGVMQESKRDDSLVSRLLRFYKCGGFVGKIFCMVISLHHLYLRILDYLDPEEKVDLAPDMVVPTYYQG